MTESAGRYQLQKGRFIRGIISLAVLATCIRVWIGPVSIVEPAQTQPPDSTMQRGEPLEETKRTNQLLIEIRQLPGAHAFNVRIASADNQADAPAGHRGH